MTYVHLPHLHQMYIEDLLNVLEQFVQLTTEMSGAFCWWKSCSRNSSMQLSILDSTSCGSTVIV